jgi:hypothetical protein
MVTKSKHRIHRLQNLWILKLKSLSILRVWNLPSKQSIDWRICPSHNICILWNLSVYGLCNWQIPHSTDWQIPQFTNSQILQSMDAVLGGYHTLGIVKFLNWWIDRCINLWIVCRVWNLLITLKNMSICILWNNHTIHRLMHLWICRLRNLSICRVGIC